MTFGEKIKKLRNDNHLTQQQLADQINVTRQAVSSWENEKSFPDFAILLSISEKYNISLDDLVKGDSKLKEAIDKKDVIRGVRGIQLTLVLIAGLFAIMVGFMSENFDKNNFTYLKIGNFALRQAPFNSVFNYFDIFSLLITFILFVLVLILSRVIDRLSGKDQKLTQQQKTKNWIKVISIAVIVIVLNFAIIHNISNSPNLILGCCLLEIAVVRIVMFLFELKKE